MLSITGLWVGQLYTVIYIHMSVTKVLVLDYAEESKDEPENQGAVAEKPRAFVGPLGPWLNILPHKAGSFTKAPLSFY